VLNPRLPHSLVLDLHYDANNDVLVAGLFGRGIWALSGFFGGNAADLELPEDEEEAEVAAGAPSDGCRRATDAVPPTAPRRDPSSSGRTAGGADRTLKCKLQLGAEVGAMPQ
jgi:hypothetical protein